VIDFNFHEFDRQLEDFRDVVARAANIQHDAVKRYVAMIKALDTAFALYYEEMPDWAKAEIVAAFKKLCATADTFGVANADPTNVVQIAPSGPRGA
jgi:hypothetical protein